MLRTGSAGPVDTRTDHALCPEHAARILGPSDLHLRTPGPECCPKCRALLCECWPIAGGAL